MRARLAFSCEETKFSGILFSDYACRGKKKIFLIAKRKKNYQITQILHYFVCNICTVHNDLFIMFSISVCINVPSYVHCRTLFAKVVFYFANQFPAL